MMPQAYGIMPGVAGQQPPSQQFGSVGAGPYNQMLYNQQVKKRRWQRRHKQSPFFVK
jgi:hypothetical protein